MSDDELLHNMSRAFWASNGGSDNSMRAVLDVLQKAGYRRCAKGQRTTQWCDRAEKSEAEVERLRADAERYRWLRDVATGDEWDYIMTTEDTDAAIDAARGGAMSRIINGREYFCGEEIEQSFTRWRDARIEELEAEVERLRARDEEWQRKASAWMASPEAAQRLDGYRELAQRVNAAEEAAARGKK